MEILESMETYTCSSWDGVLMATLVSSIEPITFGKPAILGKSTIVEFISSSYLIIFMKLGLMFESE